MTTVNVTGTPVTVAADGSSVPVTVDESPVTVAADGSVDVTVEQVDVTVATSGSSVPVTVTGQTVAVTVLGAAGVTDDPFIDHDLTGDLTDLNGGTVNLGTNSEIIFRYRRVGRMVEGWINISAAADATYGNGGPLYFPGGTLPYQPRHPIANPVNAALQHGYPGGFGFFGGSSFRFGSSMVVVDFGPGDLAFVKNDVNAGGINSLVTDSSPQDLTGIEWIYAGYVVYEAASAA